MLTEIEAGINDRPLTYCSDDNNELLPLTPSMLVNNRRITGLPEIVDENEILDPTFKTNPTLLKVLKIINHY